MLGRAEALLGGPRGGGRVEEAGELLLALGVEGAVGAGDEEVGDEGDLVGGRAAAEEPAEAGAGGRGVAVGRAGRRGVAGGGDEGGLRIELRGPRRRDHERPEAREGVGGGERDLRGRARALAVREDGGAAPSDQRAQHGGIAVADAERSDGTGHDGRRLAASPAAALPPSRP